MGKHMVEKKFFNEHFILIKSLFLPFRNSIFVFLNFAFGDSNVFQDWGVIFIEGSVCSFVLCGEF